MARLERKIDRLTGLLDLVAPLVGGLVDTADAHVMGSSGGADDFDARVQRVVALLARLSQPQVLRTLEHLVNLVPHLHDLPEIVVEAKARGPGQRHGLFGLLGVLREPHVQRAVGVAVEAARAMGARLETHDPSPLPALDDEKDT